MLMETKPGKINLEEIGLERVKTDNNKLATPPHLIPCVTPSVTSAGTIPVLELEETKLEKANL